MKTKISLGNNRNQSTNNNNYSGIDIKGTLTLAGTIISFLAGISLFESDSASAGYYRVAGLFAVSSLLLAAFIAIEKRSHSPLLDLKVMTSKFFLPPVIILMLVSMSIFMVYQTIPVMVRSPPPLGFGGDALDSARVQMPFMIVLFIGTIISGFLLNKIGSTRLLLLGTAISAIGFFSLFIFHGTENAVSVGLGIIAAGLSLSISGAFNIILLSVPMQVTGIALGMAMLLNLVGMSVGPSLAGVFQQINPGTVQGVSGLFPTEKAYNLIFVTSAIVSLASLSLALALSRKKIILSPSNTATADGSSNNA